jgi:histidinol-phosphatase
MCASKWDSAACSVSRVGSYDDDLRFAHVLADAADDITTRRFRALDLRVETKPDLTPVSDADRATEDSLRNILRRSRPRDAVIGEESGQTGISPRRWVLDPIDATKNYVRGVPVWATLIGLMDGDEVVVGVVTAPALGRRWWAASGGGAWTGRSLTKASRCRVSQVTKLSDASFSYSGIGGWAETGRLDGFLSLSQAVWRTRGFGDFWSHMLVAEGAVDISAEPEVSLWDLAALQVIVEEAGGRFTSMAGVATPSGGSVVCTNGPLHDEVLARLADGPEPPLTDSPQLPLRAAPNCWSYVARRVPRRLSARYAGAKPTKTQHRILISNLQRVYNGCGNNRYRGAAPPATGRQAVSSRSNRPAAPGWFPRPSGRRGAWSGNSPVLTGPGVVFPHHVGLPSANFPSPCPLWGDETSVVDLGRTGGR